MKFSWNAFPCGKLAITPPLPLLLLCNNKRERERERAVHRKLEGSSLARRCRVCSHWKPTITFKIWNSQHRQDADFAEYFSSSLPSSFIISSSIWVSEFITINWILFLSHSSFICSRICSVCRVFNAVILRPSLIKSMVFSS